MEKYAKLMKGLEVCAGPDCCKDGCPYYGETTGAMTCRARLLRDAEIAIDNEQALRESAEEGLRNAVEELDKLTEALEKETEGRRSVEAHRDAIAADQAALHAENKALREKMEVLRDTNRSLDRELCRLQHDMPKEDTDRPSVCDKALVEEVCKLIVQAKYQEGRADALAEIVERCSFGGGGRHE